MDEEKLFSLKRLMVAGESPPLDLIQRATASQRLEVCSAYGPMETTVLCSANIFKMGEKVTNVGKPVANTAIYILDDEMEPIKGIGIPGEIVSKERQNSSILPV